MALQGTEKLMPQKKQDGTQVPRSSLEDCRRPDGKSMSRKAAKTSTQRGCHSGWCPAGDVLLTSEGDVPLDDVTVLMSKVTKMAGKDCRNRRCRQGWTLRDAVKTLRSLKREAAEVWIWTDVRVVQVMIVTEGLALEARRKPVAGDGNPLMNWRLVGAADVQPGWVEAAGQEDVSQTITDETDVAQNIDDVLALEVPDGVGREGIQDGVIDDGAVTTIEDWHAHDGKMSRMGGPRSLEVEALEDLIQMAVDEVLLLAKKRHDHPDDEVHAGPASDDGMDVRRDVGGVDEASNGCRVEVLLVGEGLRLSKKRRQVGIIGEAGEVLEEVGGLDVQMSQEARRPKMLRPVEDVEDGKASSGNSPR